MSLGYFNGEEQCGTAPSKERTWSETWRAGGWRTLTSIANLGALPYLILEGWEEGMPALFLALF